MMEAWREMGNPRAASPILCEDQRRLRAEAEGKGFPFLEGLLADRKERGAATPALRDVAEILTEREEALQVAFRSTPPMQGQLVTSLTVRKTNPAATVAGLALQRDRRAPFTIAAGDESPMNFPARSEPFL